MSASTPRDEPAKSKDLLSELRRHEAQAIVLRAAYSAAMAKDGMSYWVAEAASDLRRKRGRLMVHIAAELSEAESKISRFERHISFPRDLDETISAYARDLEVAAIDIWQHALDMWRADGGASRRRAKTAPPRPPGELGRRLASAPPKARDQEQTTNRPAADRRQEGDG